MAIKLNDQHDESMASVNMTPLIDIILVLLIIFMVTSSLTLESGLDIDIPKTKSETNEKNNKAVIISLDSGQKIYIQGNIVEFDNLGAEISRSLKEAETKLVIFEGDKLATLGRTIEIMDIAKQAGAKRFAIAAESK